MLCTWRSFTCLLSYSRHLLPEGDWSHLRRWARRRGKGEIFGHQQGVQALQRTVQLCRRCNIECLTVCRTLELYTFALGFAVQVSVQVQAWQLSSLSSCCLGALLLHTLQTRCIIMLRPQLEVLHAGVWLFIRELAQGKS